MKDPYLWLLMSPVCAAKLFFCTEIINIDKTIIICAAERFSGAHPFKLDVSRITARLSVTEGKTQRCDEKVIFLSEVNSENSHTDLCLQTVGSD